MHLCLCPFLLTARGDTFYSFRLAKATLTLIPLFGIHEVVFIFATDEQTTGILRYIKVFFTLFLNSFQVREECDMFLLGPGHHGTRIGGSLFQLPLPAVLQLSLGMRSPALPPPALLLSDVSCCAVLAGGTHPKSSLGGLSPSQPWERGWQWGLNPLFSPQGFLVAVLYCFANKEVCTQHSTSCSALPQPVALSCQPTPGMVCAEGTAREKPLLSLLHHCR